MLVWLDVEMIRHRPNADNTMHTPAPQNISWNRMKREPCIYCGLYHDGAGRTLDENGKLFKSPANYIKCPVEIERATKVNQRHQPRPKIRIKRD